MIASVRGIVRALDRGLPIEKVRTMHQVVMDSLSEPRWLASFVVGFAIFALGLAAIGIYGVISYSVEQRTHEIGVRVATGATNAQVVSLVVRKGAALAAAGVAIGEPASLGASRLLASVLYGVSPRDLSVFLAVPALLVAVALVASYLPARRAGRVDPISALRCE